MSKKEDKRVKLKNGFLKALIEKAAKNIGSQRELSKRLGFKSSSIITKYKQDTRLPSLIIVQKIAELAKIQFSQVEESIKELKEGDWWRKEGGRRGGTTTFRKYGSKFYKQLNKKLQKKYGYEYFRSLGLKTYKKYGKEHMRIMASKVGKLLPTLYPEEKKEWGKKGGVVGAEKQKPTMQEINLIEDNIENGISHFKVHYSINNNESFKNFDFVYFLNGKIVLIEEVTDIPPVKNRIYSKILEAYEKKKFLKKAKIIVPMVLTFNYSKKSANIIRSPLDAISILLQEGILPIFYDLNFPKRIDVIKSILNGYNNFAIREYKMMIEKWLQNEMNKRKNEIRKGARSQLNTTMNKEEKLLNENLLKYGLKPKGKHMLLNKYGAVVVDNFVELGNSQVLFEVKKVKDRRSFMKAALDLASKFFVIKRLYNARAKCVSVLVSDKEIKLNSDSYQIRLLEKYSDIVIKNNEFAKLKLLRRL